MTADSTEWRRREDILSESCNCQRWAGQSIYTYLGQSVLPLPGHQKHLAKAVSENPQCILRSSRRAVERKEKKTHSYYLAAFSWPVPVPPGSILYVRVHMNGELPGALQPRWAFFSEVLIVQIASKKEKCSFGRPNQLPIQPLQVSYKSLSSWNHPHRPPGGQHGQVMANAEQNDRAKSQGKGPLN